MNDVVRGDVGEVDDGPEYDVNFRDDPGRYRHTPDERGVFKIEPYKSELLPLWAITDLAAATEATDAICDRYREYRDAGDFVGMDVALAYRGSLDAVREDDAYERLNAAHRERYGEE